MAKTQKTREFDKADWLTPQPAQGLPDKIANTIVNGDCVAGLRGLPAGCVDLVFADPPFNIGYDYDVYDDRLDREKYLDWSREWISAVYSALKPSGTFWLAIGDEYAAELKLLSQEVGFTCRSWVIWYYTFGVNCKFKFSRSHAHLFHFVKDPRSFTFRHDRLENRIPSARQLVYNDKRSNPNGRLADDTWILRPQDLGDCFSTGEDTWYFPRVAGTFKERAGFHGCQMPEQLLGRIVRLCSEEGDVVVDPFSGSATTLSTAKKLGRRFVGFELSTEYAKRGKARLARIEPGDPLDGSAEPTMSAPATPSLALPAGGPGTRSAAQVFEKQKRRAKDSPSTPPAPTENTATDFTAALLDCYRSVHDGYSLDRVLADPALVAALHESCVQRGLTGTPREWSRRLFQLRKAGRLADLVTTKRTELTWADCDPFLAGIEFAWRRMLDSGAASLDDILADPEMAARFDAWAAVSAPGGTPLVYRWGALKLRKDAYVARSRAQRFEEVPPPVETWREFDPTRPVDDGPAGLYAIPDPADSRKVLYVGTTENLSMRLARHLSRGAGRSPQGLSGADQALVAAMQPVPNRVWRWLPWSTGLLDLLAVRAAVCGKSPPSLNVADLIQN
jgi:site-specific DNA-methyltransferase (adenine-specific)